MMELLRGPHGMTVVIVALYCCNVVRYGFAGLWGSAAYWICAAGITVSATWLVGK
jgi:hypothetical protein